MDRSEAIALLRELQVETIDHFGRPLHEHLIGTWSMLRNWGEPSHVCSAGLTHSVYGTATFKSAAVARSERERVRRSIGERAEELVYLFGTSDRRRLLLDNETAPFHWIDHRTGEVSALDEATLRDLVTLDVANFLEQLTARPDLPTKTVEEMRFRFTIAVDRMSESAANACRSTFDDWPDPAGMRADS